MSSPSESAVTGGFPQVPPPPVPALHRGAQRLHIAALGVWALSSVGPLIFLIIAGTVAPIFAVLAVLGTLVASSVRWWRFTWHVDDEALVIEQGLLQRQRRVIPRERIQSVEVVRKLRHRLFGVVELRVESIGGGSTEGQLDALRPSDAWRLRADLLGRAPAGAPTASAGLASTQSEDAEQLVRMRPGELVLAGVTGGRVGVVAALLGFASQVFGEQVGEFYERAFGFIGATGIQGVLLAGAVFLIAVFVLSVVATTLTYWDFTLTRDPRELHTTRGLLDQRSGTIPHHRIQSVRIEENLLRRALGRAAVRVEVAGRAGSDASETSVVLPLGTRARAHELVDELLERRDIAGLGLEAAPQGARARRDVRAVAATVVPTIALVVWQGTPGLAGLLLLLPFAALARASYRALGRAYPNHAVVARSGVFVRVTHVTPERCLQAVALTSTPFQRRRSLATLTMHIARSPGGGDDPAIVDLPEDEADVELVRLARVADEAARRPRSLDGITVRTEEPEDRDGIHAVHTEAFGQDVEAALVDALRQEPDFDPGLSLVAEADGDVVGHALLTRVAVEGPEDAGPLYALAPVAVRPERQGQGIGGRLVKRALTAATTRGGHRVVVLGEKAFYERFGFEEARRHGVEAPFDVDDDAWLVRLLPADDRTGRGRVAYPAPFAAVPR